MPNSFFHWVEEAASAFDIANVHYDEASVLSASDPTLPGHVSTLATFDDSSR